MTEGPSAGAPWSDGAASPGRHVVHVTEAPLGGVIAYLDELLSLQTATGVGRVDLITPEVNLDALAHVLPGCGAVVSFAQGERSAAPLTRLARLTLSHVRIARPDVLHVHSTYAGAVVRLLRPALPRGLRIVYCPHGWAFSRRGRGSMRRAAALAERRLAWAADRILCISEFERREAVRIGIPARRLVVIDNGVADRPPAGPPPAEGPLRVGFVGRFDAQKGHDVFLEVMRRLPEMQGFAVGRAITTAAVAGAVPPNVSQRGWMPRDALAAFYEEIDLLVVPSRWEGFGLVAIEAMRAGRAVLASRVGGLADVVEDRATGRLFEPNDVEGIVRLLRSTSRAELRAQGEAGRRRYLERYTAQRMAREVAALYDDLLVPAPVRG